MSALPWLRSARGRAVLGRMPGLILGLVLFGMGIALKLRSGLGLSPWDAFHQGVARHVPFSIGLVVILVSAVVLLAWIPLKQRVGIGTVFNVMVVGSTVDVTLLVVGETDALLVRWLYLLAGIGFAGIGSGLYIGARLGPGPRDGVMTGLADRGISIRLARLLIEGTVLVAGWLLGGAVGVGTVVFAVLIGPLVQFFLRLLDRGPIEAAASGRTEPRRSA